MKWLITGITDAGVLAAALLLYNPSVNIEVNLDHVYSKVEKPYQVDSDLVLTSISVDKITNEDTTDQIVTASTELENPSEPRNIPEEINNLVAQLNHHDANKDDILNAIVRLSKPEHMDLLLYHFEVDSRILQVLMHKGWIKHQVVADAVIEKFQYLKASGHCNVPIEILKAVRATMAYFNNLNVDRSLLRQYFLNGCQLEELYDISFKHLSLTWGRDLAKELYPLSFQASEQDKAFIYFYAARYGDQNALRQLNYMANVEGSSVAAEWLTKVVDRQGLSIPMTEFMVSYGDDLDFVSYLLRYRIKTG